MPSTTALSQIKYIKNATDFKIIKTVILSYLGHLTIDLVTVHGYLKCAFIGYFKFIMVSYIFAQSASVRLP